MNWLRRVMYGRNGADHLGMTCLVASMILSLAAGFVRVTPVRTVLIVLYYLLLALFMFRFLSRNIYARQTENTRFLAATRPLRDWGRLRMRMARERKTHKYLKCPSCKQRLRVPRGRGKISVRCSRCSEQFVRKS